MFEDIIITEDLSYDDILELAEQILVPVQELLNLLKGEKNEYKP